MKKDTTTKEQARLLGFVFSEDKKSSVVVAANSLGFSVRPTEDKNGRQDAAWLCRAPIVAAALAKTPGTDSEPTIAVAVRGSQGRPRSLMLFHHSRAAALLSLSLDSLDANPSALVFLDDRSLIGLQPTHLLHIRQGETTEATTTTTTEREKTHRRGGIDDHLVSDVAPGDNLNGLHTRPFQDFILNPRPTWTPDIDAQSDIGAMFDAYLQTHIITTKPS